MGKRQDFIDLYKSGLGTRQKYIDLSGHGFRKKSTAVPIDPLRELMIYEMLMSGALPSELKHGGVASLAHGGRIGFFQGALADTKEGKSMSPGTSADYTPGAGHRTGGDGPNRNVIESPILSNAGNNYIDYTGEGTSPSFNMRYSPNRKMNILARISNQNFLDNDDINVDGSVRGTLGNNFNYDVPFTNEGIQGVDLNYKNFSANIDPNKNYNLGYQTNRDGWNTGVNYDSDGNLMATIGTNFNKGGLAGILNLS